MKWIYGKQDWKIFERGQENCYLMTNGLGGFSSMTMTGSAARNDHAFLMACMKAPNNRYNVIHRLAEKIETEGKGYSLSSQEFADGTREEGYRNLSAFSYDACDGRRSTGSAKAGCRICAVIKAGEYREISVVFSVSGATERLPAPGTAGEIIRGQKEYCRELGDRAGFSSDMAECLAKSASQFIAERESTGGDTILAGFPFFEDWGRDTMIALPGICLSTRRYDEAKSILRTFARYEKEGLMPNLFPEGGKEPMYNTVDAALLFINCVWLYDRATGDMGFAEEMYPVMERIVEHYRKGTCFGIHMDDDGLIMAGEGLDQVTWMDVRVGEILPTPRHGKPVEINAYWYNALRIMAAFSKRKGGDGRGHPDPMQPDLGNIPALHHAG
ncbi:amylo-alpha-1,6-glucosidase [Mediterraneibacter glycyrrhizinilyticus]|uniref:amylo-alpha-1,6-glucosidase n=1 Tax=Mediterraneibacter glycyrrhizinilyticus TaxID=342942 RepID=UPI002ED35933